MISVIIPVYNEGERLEKTIKTVSQYLKKNFSHWELIISEDGSTDSSYLIAKKFAKNNQKIKVLHSKKRLGKGGGIKRGVNAVIGDITVFYDADMAVPVTEIKKHIKELKNYDFLIGSRAVAKSEILQQQPLHRQLLGGGFNQLVRFVLGIPFKDTQCGFKYFKTEVLKSTISNLEIIGFAFDVEIILSLLSKGYKGKEVPVQWKHIDDSKVNVLTATPKMFLDIMKLFFKYKVWH